MKKEILLLFITYCLSVCAAKYAPWLDAGVVLVFLAAVLLLRLFLFRDKRRMAILLVLFAGIGFLRASYLNNAANFIPTEFEGATVYVEGTVQEVTEGADYCLYTLAPETVYAKTAQDERVYAPVRYRIAVTVYERYAAIQPYACGDRILVRGVLKIPEGSENTGAFDYGLWHKTNGVYASIRTDEAYTKQLGTTKTNVLYRTAFAVRGYASAQFERYIGGDSGALLSGIVLSERKNMSDQLRSAIDTAGLSHMCVASGMHVSMLCGFLLWLFSQLRFPRSVSFILCVLAMHFFALIVGDGPSIQRAVLMFDFSVLAYFTRGDEDRLYTCMCVAFIMLLLQPLYLFSIGFLLSFACVFGILIFRDGFQRALCRRIKWKALGSLLAVSLSAQVFTLPILAMSFHALPLYALMYNLLITWLVSPLMLLSGVLLGLAGVWPLAAQGIGFVLNLVLLGMCKSISMVQYLPFATVTVGTPNLFGGAVYYAAVLGIWACLAKKKDYARICERVICVCILALTVVSFADSFYAKLHFINVGEGDSALLRTPYGLTVLVDGGGVNREYKNVGEETLLPYLKSCGISEIDYAVVSHYDTDHADGVLYICENVQVKNLILPYRHPKYTSVNKTKLEACAAARGIRVHYMQGGESMQLPGGVQLEALSPDARMLERRLPENELSLVLRVSYGDMRMLFTGDIGKLAEKRLYENCPDMEADILKVAHHGSDTSSMPLFLEKVNARYAVVSAGDYSVAKHPAPRVYNTLQHSGAEIYNTANAGDVTFYFTRRGVQRIR